MKKTITSALILFTFLTGFSQSATSIANGNWMNPSTWNCACVPLPGYSVTINHNVALDTGFYVPSGGITINSGASLVGNNPTRNIWLNGGTLTNNGILNVHNLWTQTGTFANSGTIELNAFLNSVNFTNAGTFQNIDSLYTTGVVINNGSFHNIAYITNGGTFTNNGICNYNQFTNLATYNNNSHFTCTDISNFGALTNADTMIALNNGWNVETWSNLSGGYFSVNNSFLNGDSIQHNAVFNNNGRVVINENWYNLDTTKGTATGSFVVADTSINWGWMKGSFDFCDLSSSISSPTVDYNSGMISNGITWCQTTGMAEVEKDEINIYPNPASDFVNVELQKQNNFEIRIYNSNGGLISAINNKTKIDISGYAPGLYFISVVVGNNTNTRKIVKL